MKLFLGIRYSSQKQLVMFIKICFSTLVPQYHLNLADNLLILSENKNVLVLQNVFLSFINCMPV